MSTVGWWAPRRVGPGRGRAWRRAGAALAILGLLTCSGTGTCAGQERAQEKPKSQGPYQNIPLPESAKAYRDLAYLPGAHERQKLDLFLPSEGKGWPLVVWVHGGGWRNGDKSRNPALHLLNQGFAVASLDYRLSGDAVFPAQIQDCKAAVRWLKVHAPEYGYDPDRIGIWGGSAGGHLVGLLGTSADVEDFDIGPDRGVSARVQAVCFYYGVSDFLAMDRPSTPDGTGKDDDPEDPVTRLFGGPIAEHRREAILASPVTHVSPDDPPFLILHGDRDRVVSPRQSEILDEALRKAGVESTFIVVKGAGHGIFRSPEVQAMVDAFFARHLKGRKGG